MRKAYKKHSLQTEENYSFLVESLEDYGILMMDTKGKIVSWNEGAKKIFGYTREEAVGKSISLIFSKPDRRLRMPELEISTAKDHGRADDERQHERKDGSLFWATGVMWAIKDDQGNLKGLSKLIRDISERKIMEETIRHQSLHDPLTGLPNRRSFEDRFALAITKAKRNKELLGIIFLDLDDFKKVNDTLGHDSGDILLQEVAQRLSSVLRKGDSICRIGGDEFILLIDNLKKSKDMHKVIAAMQNALKKPFKISNKQLKITSSMGVSFYPIDGKSPRILEKRADIALYKAKDDNKNNYKAYSKF